MKLAIKIAREGIKCGGGPFGCVILQGDEVVVQSNNQVVNDCDATGHAEIRAIRLAGKKLKTPFLSDCTLYSTTEPCPMCYSACHWAQIKRIVYGSCIDDAIKFGLNELNIPSKKMKHIGQDRIVLKGGVLRDECIKLFEEWRDLSGEKY